MMQLLSAAGRIPHPAFCNAQTQAPSICHNKYTLPPDSSEYKTFICLSLLLLLLLNRFSHVRLCATP